MPSQDDNLDELLKQMSMGDGEEGPESRDRSRLDIDSVAEMTEEEIAAFLSAGVGGDKNDTEPYRASFGESDAPQGDVLEMLDETGDRDLKEIKNLLERSDRNEDVSGGSLASGADDGKSPADRLLADIEGAGEQEMAEEMAENVDRRALKKEQRKKEKIIKKEAKQREKDAARAEKKRKRSHGEAEAKDTRKETAENSVKEYDMMLDRDLLDSIVSGAAGRAGRPEAPAQEDNGEGLASLMEYAKADLDGASGSEADWVEKENASPELDIMTLDMAEADALLEDISEKEEEAEEKEGLFSKMVSFLTEEESEAENEDVRLSDENEEILNELDNEKPQKSKKAKKPKKKAAKKDKKKAKPKKPPKPKKEKKPREQEPFSLGKRLTFKKALPLIVFGVSLGVAIFLITNLSIDYSDKKAAQAAYIAGDYEACYQNLFGKKLNETEAAMYGKSESILYIRLWYQEYEMLAEQGSEVKALDSLIQTVQNYPELYKYAAQWNAGMDVYEIYLDILDTLYNKYGLSEDQALEIAGVRSDLEYTRIVTALTQGYSYDSWQDAFLPAGATGDSSAPSQPSSEGDGLSGQPEGGSSEEENSSEGLPDALPEESDLQPGDYVE